MKRSRAISGIAVAMLAAAIGIGVAAPAQAAPRIDPVSNGTSGCPSAMRTNVPNSDEVRRSGAKALFTAEDLRKNPNAGDDVPPAMKAVLSRNPKWLTTIQCGPTLEPSSTQVTSDTVPGAASTATTTPVYSPTSPNWAGYRLMNVDYPLHQFIDYVGGSWNVPSPYPPNSGIDQESASEWVGIGSGNASYDQLLQAGTVAYSGPGLAGIGASGTYGFFEMYPYQQEQMIQNYSVVGGDVASSYVTYLAASNKMVWTLCTQSANKCVSGTEQLTMPSVTTEAVQAEWILERHGFNGHTSSLLQFNTPIDFYAAYGEIRGGPGNIEDKYVIGQGPAGTAADFVHLDQITMTNCSGSPALESTSALNYPVAGEFQLVWKAKGDTC